MQVNVPQICWHDESARIMAIDFFPNSRYFVTCSQVNEGYDTGIRFWKLGERKEVRVLTDALFSVTR